jgi:hypothetical protein
LHPYEFFSTMPKKLFFVKIPKSGYISDFF